MHSGLIIPLKTARDIEEAIAEFTSIKKRQLGVQHQRTNLKLNTRNTHGKSRTKLMKNENSEEDGR
jgi:hypothetical protein